MSRISGDEYRNGKLFNGYDYDNQCWVIDGVIQRCGHKDNYDCKCYGKLHVDEKVVA